MLPCRFPLTALLLAGALSAADPTIPQLLRQSEMQPIELHARFVDQSGAALAGVRVQADIWCQEPGGRRYNQKDLGLRVLDADGRLDLDGETGGYLRLALADERYFLGDARRRPQEAQGIIVRYSPNGSELLWLEHGSAERPTTIPAWKREGAQPLIRLAGDVRFAYDAKPFGIDLAAGRIVDQGGDLRVAIDAAADEGARKASADHLGFFPYRVTVTAVDGGFAPYQGHEGSPSFEGLIGIVAPEFPLAVLDGPTRLGDRGTRGVPFMGFVRLRSGRLIGRLSMYIGMEAYYRVEQGRVVVRIQEALLNPTGSRSLESDAAQLTQVKLTDARQQPAP